VTGILLIVASFVPIIDQGDDRSQWTFSLLEMGSLGEIEQGARQVRSTEDATGTTRRYILPPVGGAGAALLAFGILHVFAGAIVLTLRATPVSIQLDTTATTALLAVSALFLLWLLVRWESGLDWRPSWGWVPLLLSEALLIILAARTGRGAKATEALSHELRRNSGMTEGRGSRTESCR
jgi:hypothetical protein